MSLKIKLNHIKYFIGNKHSFNKKKSFVSTWFSRLNFIFQLLNFGCAVRMPSYDVPFMF